MITMSDGLAMHGLFGLKSGRYIGKVYERGALAQYEAHRLQLAERGEKGEYLSVIDGLGYVRDIQVARRAVPNARKKVARDRPLTRPQHR